MNHEIKIEAAEKLLEDYELLLAETTAQLMWQKKAIQSTKQRLAEIKLIESRAIGRIVLQGLIEYRKDTERQKVIYEQYIDDLHERLTETLKEKKS